MGRIVNVPINIDDPKKVSQLDPDLQDKLSFASRDGYGRFRTIKQVEMFLKRLIEIDKKIIIFGE